MRRRDYFWIIGILLGITIEVTSVRLSNDYSIVNIISIAAGLVSIVLGIIAISQSCFYNYASNQINDKINDKLNSINSNTEEIISNMKNNLATSMKDNNIDDKIIEKVINEFDSHSKILIKSSMSVNVLDARLKELIENSNEPINICEIIKKYSEKKHIDLFEATRIVAEGLHTLSDVDYIEIKWPLIEKKEINNKCI